MDPKITKLIDQYLSGTISPEDKITLEAQLAASADLRNELEIQRSVMEAAKRASQRLEIKDAAKSYRRNRLIRNAGLSALIALFITSTVVFFTSTPKKEKEPVATEIAPITTAAREKMDNNQDFKNIPIQYFQIPKQGSVQLSKQGVLISVPEKAFMKNGKPFSGNVILQYQEALTGLDILKSGLNTMTGDDLLETQGMFSVTGYSEDGEPLQFNPKVGVYIQSPIDDCKTGMQLYDGKKMADGSIDWVAPEPLAKIPILADMSEINLYPETYEDHLDQEKWKKDKESRDSLYLSLEHTIDLKRVRESKQFTAPNGTMSSESDVFRFDEDGKGKVFRKNKSTQNTFLSIDDVIAWDFTPRLLGNEIWEITATAIIRDGFYIYAADAKEKSKQTELKFGESKIVEIIEKTSNASTPRNVRTKFGNIKGFTGEASFTIHLKCRARTQMEIPVRALFKLGNKEMEYSRSIRGNSVIIGQTPEQKNARIDSLASVQLDGDFVLPSKVMGIWNSALNNTNLSTREFERRMAVIHNTCDNDVLDMYVDGLNKSISDIDREVVKMGYPEFQEFADEHVGKIDINDAHLAGITKFYEKAIEALKVDARTKVKSEEDRIVKWNEHVSKQRVKDKEQSAKRNKQYVDEFKNFNKVNVINQLKATNGFKIVKGSFQSNTARRNCDRWIPYVAAGEYTGPLKDESKEITVQNTQYHDFSIAVKDHDKYIDLYMYVFADNFNSYQRLKGEEGEFSCQMNSKIKYAVGVVGITEDGYEFFEHDFVKGGDLGTVSLKKVSEQYLEGRIKKMNNKRLKDKLSVKNDLAWLKTQRKDYKQQRLYKDMIVFRRGIKLKIFPCVTVSRRNTASLDEGEESNLATSSRNTDAMKTEEED